MVVSLAACSKPQQPSTPDTQKTDAPASESTSTDTQNAEESKDLEGEITFWHSFTQGPRMEKIQAAADAFMAEHPKVKSTIETFSWADFYTKWTTGLASGNVPDISSTVASQLVEMIDAEAVRPVDNLIDEIGRDRFMGNALTEMTAEDGNCYGVPLYLNTEAMWYRKDLLEKYDLDVPTTWEEMYEAAKIITDGENGEVYGAAMPMVSSLFIKVPRERREEVKTIYDRAAKEIGDVPIVVANDGDVTALAGYMSLGTGCVMGLAMGTSEAVGYVDADGNILGWFNELAFAPVDLNEHAMRDEWSGDIGVGCKYFSQDAVSKLAPAAGIALAESLTPAEKLKAVQKLAESGNPYALAIFDSIGVYLAHTLSLYEMFYDIRDLLVLGRVASGVGGDRIVAECRRVLNEEYPDLAAKLRVQLPDENFRRVGQSVAAASLPDIR